MSSQGYKCRMPGCDADGFLALRGRPRVKFCEEHYKAVVKRIALITRAMRRIEQRCRVLGLNAAVKVKGNRGVILEWKKRAQLRLDQVAGLEGDGGEVEAD